MADPVILCVLHRHLDVLPNDCDSSQCDAIVRLHCVDKVVPARITTKRAIQKRLPTHDATFRLDTLKPRRIRYGADYSPRKMTLTQVAELSNSALNIRRI